MHPVTAAAALVDTLGADAGVPILLHGEGTAAWPVLREAGRRGLDTRIGLSGELPPPPTEPVMVVRSLRLPAELDQRLKVAARSRGVPMSTLVREWIELELAARNRTSRSPARTRCERSPPCAPRGSSLTFGRRQPRAQR